MKARKCQCGRIYLAQCDQCHPKHRRYPDYTLGDVLAAARLGRETTEREFGRSEAVEAR